jgi:hypothetical protein
MGLLVSIMVWLFLSASGIALAFFVGIEGKVLNKNHRDRSLLPLVRILLAILVVWIIMAVAMVFYQSKWYLLSISIVAICFYACYSGNPIEKKEAALEPEQQKLNDRWEYLVKTYDNLLEIKHANSEDFASEDILPASKGEMAQAIQFVYWFRLMQFNPDSKEEELLSRYNELANFIKSDDAAFMNDFEKMVSSKKPGDFQKAVEFLKKEPNKFEENRNRMHAIHDAVNAEREMLWESWDNAREHYDK